MKLKNENKMTEQELLHSLELGESVPCKWRGKDAVLTYRTAQTARIKVGNTHLVALGGSLIKFSDLEFER